VGKPDGQRQLGIHRHRWEYNIEINTQNLVWGVDWIDMAHDRNM
jgi:hypothetical protein